MKSEPHGTSTVPALRHSQRLVRLAVVTIVALVNPAQAAGPSPVPVSETRGLPFGPFDLFPSVAFESGYDDNVFRSPVAEQASPIVIITPELALTNEFGGNLYSLGYRGSIGRFTDAGENDYEDHRLTLNGNLEFTTRNRLTLELGYFALHDPIGTNRTEGTIIPRQTEPDQYDLLSASGTYSYGAPEAKGRLDVYGGYFSKSYTNNLDQTRFFDRDQGRIGGIFYWNIRPRTSLLLQIQNTFFDYRMTNLDSVEQRYLAGVTWTATGKTTGTVKLGYQAKDLDAPALEDFSGFAWSVAIDWEPKTYSKLTFETSRFPLERTGSGLFKVVQGVRLTWAHRWNNRLSSTPSFLYANEDFFGTTREDDVWEFSLNINYELRKWINTGVNYIYSNVDSNEARFDYDRNLVGVFVAIGFPRFAYGSQLPYARYGLRLE